MDIHELHEKYYEENELEFYDSFDHMDFVVNLDDKAIGGLYFFDNYTEVVNIFVIPEYRNQGLGNKVLKELHKQRKGIYRLQTYFVMQDAIKMYQKFGYKIVDIDGDSVIMEYDNGH